jgi:putative ABC transport system permease protein
VSLANNLGKWLAIAVLIAAFGLASLLTMAAVSRRVREFGRLKALGWRSRRVIGQVMGESIVIGIAGGLLGVALGFAGAALVGKFAPSLTATVAPTTGLATPGGARQCGGGGGAGGTGNPFRGAFRSAARAADTVAVHLSAPVTIGVIVAAVGLAVLGPRRAGPAIVWFRRL